jgi:multidrug efflux pump
MNISELSIKRPVLATVFSLVILLFGLIGFSYLGVREYPSVDNPIITVSTSYPGANADVIENQITEPLEQNINGIPGIRSLTSVSSQGSSRITVEFELSVPLETAANDVRDKVSRAQRYLPRDCDPPTVTKADADAMPILMVAVQSDERSLLEISEIADLTIKEQLQTINNVSAVEIWGEKRYAMRLWLDPVKMAAHGVTTMDVKSSVDRENVELPSGSIEGNTIELSIRTLGLMHTADEFNNLIIRTDGQRVVRLRDIGWAELSPRDIKSYMKMNGIPMVGVVVVPQPGANHIEIANAVYERMEAMQKDLPDDVETTYGFDNTRFIRSSISEVVETVWIAFVLVIFIIFLFLRDWRVTLVPVVVIPVCLVGSFFIMYVCGFSINTLTMLAVVLAIGLVVDDAIVMTENIYIRIERGMTPREAGIEGAKEIFFAILSTTITLVAVFLPIVFMSGMTGRLFREFSLVIAGAVAISSFVALTLTPMLSTKILKKRERQNWLYRKTEPFFVWLNGIYHRSLAAFLRRRWVALVVVAGMVGLIVWLWAAVPSELAPLEDRSSVTIRTMGPEGVTYEYMRDYTEGINLLVDSLVPESKYVTARVGGGSGNIQIELVPLVERNRTQMEIADALTAAVSQRTAARSFVQQRSTFGGGRGGMPVQYVLQAVDIERLRDVLPRFMEEVNRSPVFQMSDVNLKFTKPEARISINRDKANLLGVSTQNIAQTLQYGLSGQRMGYFYMNGKQYEILGEINRQQRNKPANLSSMYIRNNAGGMIQMDNLVEINEDIAPPQLYRYNRFVAATVSAGLARGYTIGQGLAEMDRIAAEVLDDTFRTALSGESKEFRESASSLMFAFILAIVLIYLVLAAQFESFKDPLVIMLTVPLAVAGALVFMYFSGGTMNIFSQIGIIMLIGLVAKNGILIVEFANQKQEAGEVKGEAILSASLQRMRPILMTSFSTILGLLPLAFASGEGAQSRIAMGVAVTGGLLISTIMTLYIVPAMYSYISTDRHGVPKVEDPDPYDPDYSEIEAAKEKKKSKGSKPALAVLVAAAVLLPVASQAQVPPLLIDTLPATEQPTRGDHLYTLTECLSVGLMQNYSVQIARGEEQIAHNNASWGNAGFLPTLGVTSGYNAALDATRTIPHIGATSQESGALSGAFSAGLDVSWTIFNGMSVQTNWRRLRELEAMGELSARITIEDFVAQLTAEYYNYIQQTIRLRNYEYATSLSSERLRIAEARYLLGNGSRPEVLQARVDFNADSSLYITQKERIATSRINLNELMAASDIDREFAVRDTLIAINENLQWGELYDRMMSSSAELAHARRNGTLAGLDAKIVRSRAYPYLRLNAGYGYAATSFRRGDVRRRDTWGPDAGLSLGFTIFDGNRRREMRNARIEADNAQLRVAEIETALKADLATFWQAYQNNLQLLALERENVVSARQNYEAARDLYMTGVMAGIELREAQMSLLAGEERLLVALYNTKMCEISLLQVSGLALEYLR